MRKFCCQQGGKSTDLPIRTPSPPSTRGPKIITLSESHLNWNVCSFFWRVSSRWLLGFSSQLNNCPHSQFQKSVCTRNANDVPIKENDVTWSTASPSVSNKRWVQVRSRTHTVLSEFAASLLEYLRIHPEISWEGGDPNLNADCLQLIYGLWNLKVVLIQHSKQFCAWKQNFMVWNFLLPRQNKQTNHVGSIVGVRVSVRDIRPVSGRGIR